MFLLRTFFSYLGGPKELFDTRPKGERKARLDDIRSIGHLLTNFRKICLFSVALNMDPNIALKLKIKKCTGLILSRVGLN